MSISPDISSLFSLKSTLERLFGKKAWYELKESTSVSLWRKYAVKTLEAIRISINETIEIRDENWIISIEENIEFGITALRAAKSIEEIIGSLSSTLIQQTFLQIGQMPNCVHRKQVTLRKTQWKLDTYRSVQVIQSPNQREALFWSKQQKEIGFPAQRDLMFEYNRSRTSLPFSKWCESKLKKKSSEPI